MEEPNKNQSFLAQCYRRSIQVAITNEITSLAFPCISTGIYKFPKKLAAEIAIETCRKELQGQDELSIIFCCFGQDDFEIYQDIWRNN